MKNIRNIGDIELFCVGRCYVYIESYDESFAKNDYVYQIHVKSDYTEVALSICGYTAKSNLFIYTKNTLTVEICCEHRRYQVLPRRTFDRRL